MTGPKVGNVVAWADVPDGAMVRDDFLWIVKHAGRGSVVGDLSGPPYWAKFGHWSTGEPVGDATGAPWERLRGRTPTCTIVALGLTGQETDADLQRLAEVFGVREALDHLFGLTLSGERAKAVAAVYKYVHDHGLRLHALAERLHALGWRKGKTAEDAARLLREASQ